MRPITLLSAAAMAMLAFLPAMAANAAMTRPEVEKIVRETLEAHPEYITQALDSMQQRQAAEAEKTAKQALSARQAELYKDPRTPVAGNPKGDVNVVMFYDYNCGYCKRMTPDILKLISEDKNVRVFFKDFPILGDSSHLAGKASVAVGKLRKDKFVDFHTRLMNSTGGNSEASLLKTASEIGIKPEALKAEMNKPETEKTLRDNLALGMSLGVRGTPALVIGDEMVPGAIEYSTIKAKIAALRAAKKK